MIAIEHYGGQAHVVIKDGESIIAAQLFDDRLEVALVDVPPADRGQGRASQLYLALIEEAERRGLDLFSSGNISGDGWRLHQRLRELHGVKFEHVDTRLRVLRGTSLEDSR